MSCKITIPPHPFIIMDRAGKTVITEITDFKGKWTDGINLDKSYLIRLLMHIHDSDDQNVHLCCVDIEGLERPALLVMNGLRKFVVAPVIYDETTGTDIDSE